MDIGSIRADGYVNRWSLVALPAVIGEDGQEIVSGYEPRCVEDALPVDHPDAAMAAARNAAIAEGAATPDAAEARALELLASVAMPVPQVISDRQFAQALALSMPELISRDEAQAWAASGAIPAALLAIVDKLPPDYAFAARMKLSSAVEYHRGEPLVDFVAQQMQIPATDIDALWRLAASL